MNIREILCGNIKFPQCNIEKTYEGDAARVILCGGGHKFDRKD